jgi:hypothetical protein
MARTRKRTTRRVTGKRTGKSVVTAVTGLVRAHLKRHGVTAVSLRQVQTALVAATRVTNAASVVAVRRAATR